MIKRLMWFVTGLVTGVGTVVVLGKRIRRRMAELTPVRIADRGVQRVKEMGTNTRQAFRQGVSAMRYREKELQERFNGDRMGQSESPSSEVSKIIVLQDHESRRSPSPKSTPDQRSSRKSQSRSYE